MTSTIFTPADRGGPSFAMDTQPDVATGLLYRRIELHDPIRATIEYNGRGLHSEVVLLNQVTVASNRSWFWFRRDFHFMMAAPHRSYEAVLRVSIRPWLTIHRLTLSIDGEVVYEEPSDNL